MTTQEKRRQYSEQYNKVVLNLTEAVNRGDINQWVLDATLSIINGGDYLNLADDILADGASKIIKRCISQDGSRI